MHFKDYYSISKEKTELIDTFCVQLIGLFGLLALNPHSNLLKRFFQQCKVFRVGLIESTDPELIVVADKLYKKQLIRIWTLRKIFTIFESLKYQTIDTVSEQEIRDILFELNENVILPTPEFRILINNFKTGKTTLKDSVRPLYSKAILMNKQKFFTDTAKFLIRG